MNGTAECPLTQVEQLYFPFTEEKIRALKAGDAMLVSGFVFTGRDPEDLPVSASGGRLVP